MTTMGTACHHIAQRCAGRREEPPLWRRLKGLGPGAPRDAVARALIPRVEHGVIHLAFAHARLSGNGGDGLLTGQTLRFEGGDASGRGRWCDTLRDVAMT